MKKIFLLSILALSTMTGYAAETIKNQSDNEQILVDNSVYMTRKSAVSNISFYTSNYGIWGLDVSRNIGGTYWPHGSLNQYIFGGGVWFCAQKKVNDANEKLIYKKMAVVSYDPQSGTSSLVPGYISEGDSVRKGLAYKNGIYASTDYNKVTGASLISNAKPNWCLWKVSNDGGMEYGTAKYMNVVDTANRNITNYPIGPLFVSEEDFVSSFKDTDLSKYKVGATAARTAGYPIGLQFEERVMSWGSEEFENNLVILYTIENKSNDTLMNCLIGSLMDIDIAVSPYTSVGATNDRIRYLNEYPNLNLSIAWSNTNQGEYGKKMGYVGCSLIETPAVDANGFIRKDKSIFYPEEQVGLKTVKIWDIDYDVNTDSDIYDVMASSKISMDNSAGDKRLLNACGAFNMLPGDKARFAVAINFAMPAKGGEADGTIEDLTGFVGNGKMDAPCSNSGSLIGNLNKLRTEYYKAITLSVDDETVTNVMLSDIYPNPTTKAITLNYNLNTDSEVSIGVFDQLGNEIQSLTNGIRSSGSQSEIFQLNTELYSNGVYYLRVKTASGTAVKAISIVK